MRLRSRTIAAVGVAVLVAGALLSSPTYAAGPVTPASAQALGILFTGESGQCAGQGQQWTAVGSWSRQIRIDADNRGGWCELAFGVQAANVGLNYSWVSAGGDTGGQCRNQGIHFAEETDPGTFGPNIVIDTDSRSGGCHLTFMLDNAGWLVDVFYFADGAAAQCGAQVTRATVSVTNPVQLLVDTDGRAGGCILQLRLRRA